jgi:tetratricopeptide (TPR) repeat protein
LAFAILQVGGSLCTTAGHLHDAVALVDRGVALARAAGDDAVLAWGLMCRGYVGFLSGTGSGLTDYLDALVLAERADAEFLADAVNYVTAGYLLEGAFAPAKPSADRALAVAERRQVPGDIAYMRSCLGELAFHRGDWDEARDHCAHAAAIQERLDPTFSWGISACAPAYLCLLDLAQGRASEESVERLESLLTMMRAAANQAATEVGAMSEVALAERLLLIGQAAPARARLAAFLDPPALSEHARMVSARMIAFPTLAWAEAELGHDAAAAERLETGIALATARRARLYLVDALRVKGLLAAKQRRWESAQVALDEGIKLCRAMPYPYAEAKALYLYGQLHTAMGEPERARDRYQAVLVICDRLGEGLYRTVIERDLRSLAQKR